MKRVSTESICRNLISEGSVLLKNEGVLPLKKGEKVAIFGRCQINTYYSGMGSGGLVNRSYQVNMIDGLKAADHVVIDSVVEDTYRKWVEEHPYDDGNQVWAQEPWSQKEMPFTDLAMEAAKQNDKAIVVLGRTAGEDKDAAYKPGSYLLTDLEKAMIEKVANAFENVIVVFNTAAIMDMSFLENPRYLGRLKGAVQVWHGGQETGNGIADVLCGI